MLEEFASLGLGTSTLEALEKKGFSQPTEIQQAAIPLLLKEKRDVIGQAKTGTGKTAAFGLPILEIIEKDKKCVQALILAPTRELAIQNTKEIASFSGDRSFRTTCLYGGAPIRDQIRDLKGGAQVVAGTPGRVLDHLKRGTLKLDNLRFMVLDEADEMLDMGFIDDIKEILSQTPSEKRTLCFSATMPPAVMALAKKFMNDPAIIRIESKEAVPASTTQIYYEIRERDKLEALCRIIDITGEFYGIIFCRTRIQCDQVAHHLQNRGYSAEPLHGELSQPIRQKVLDKLKRKVCKIIVATDVAARGLDIENLKVVVNYALPDAPAEYIHRIGRTGRAGREGKAISLVTPKEIRTLKFIQKRTKSEIKRMELPEKDEIISVRKNRAENDLKEILDNNAINQGWKTITEDLLEHYSAEDIIAALLEKHYSGMLDSSRYSDIEIIKPGVKTQRLFIARGKKDGLDAESLVTYLASRAKVSARQFTEVSMNKESCFLSVPEDTARTLIKIFNQDGEIITKAYPDTGNKKKKPRRPVYRNRKFKKRRRR